MLVENQNFELKFAGMHKKNKDHILNKGYKNIDDFVNVKAEDLPLGSKIQVELSCDYCGETIYWEFRKAMKHNKHCCKKCSPLKVKESNLEKYGVEFPFQSKKIREKQKETMINNYGVDNPGAVPEIYEKITQTNMKRYGVKSPSQVKEFQEKATENMLKTMYANGAMQTSSQQKHLYDLLGGELNYPVSRTSLDIAFPNEMIYIEYNGGGHYVWPKFNGVSDEELFKKEMNRYSYLKSKGWKLIRIICKSDKLYDDDKMIELINQSKSYLSNYNWVELDLDNHLMKISNIQIISLK